MSIVHPRESSVFGTESATPKARRARFGSVFLVLAALGLAGFGLAEWILPGDTESVTYRAWQGPEAGTAGRDTQIATTNAEWRALWSGLRRDPPPAFDPSRQTGVAILLGQRPTPGYRVGILGTEQRGDRIIVVIEETRPPSRSLLPQQLTSPYAILLINQSAASVSVEQRVRD
ncbi:MAG TPA: protease complex subunit PrcB family protein [Vineibacter sp.]|nr:protease complex subunit PrcB family protein [Vineibacter sp.]